MIMKKIMNKKINLKTKIMISQMEKKIKISKIGSFQANVRTAVFQKQPTGGRALHRPDQSRDESTISTRRTLFNATTPQIRAAPYAALASLHVRRSNFQYRKDLPVAQRTGANAQRPSLHALPFDGRTHLPQHYAHTRTRRRSCLLPRRRRHIHLSRIGQKFSVAPEHRSQPTS